ncbi:ethanolaminephosphotransferase 1 [Pectinophora gossypiella]|uniref:ethanolaminephosphotransferase 1 n=1 Tax=Pectinophora gossypiella TaxID=13191 RepID=UPI00214ECBBC|nr:ethanolaminephosphotransferase 1 [Pectinophora gossypiella]XP_049867884.1 ethanolaminephosphotransferase 1 [Pectinophora gossypiella]XP_049867885.1 ethanolaminephosphotransferase 1 [Pectinophora gossypiella]
MARFLTDEQLKGFEKYKYNSIDTSILSNYVMHPFWNWCVQFCPEWVAPNLLTFTGFLLTVLNFLLFSYYDYGFYALTDDNPYNDHIPSWVWAITAVNLFVAYTLDGIDGKQARRTGTSGPLGELFDHGLDSYSAVLIPTCLYSIFGRDELSPLRFFFVIWNIFINFYLTHWEKYNTGVMFLPWGYDFTMIGSCILLLVTSVVGPRAWHVQLPGGVTPGLVFELVLYFSAMITSQTIILWNIYKSYRDKTGKMRSFPEAVRPLLPLLAFFTLSTLWAVYSPSDVLSRGPRLFYILTGTIFSNINCRLIVSQMSDTRCEAFNGLLLPYGLVMGAVMIFRVSPMTELLLLAALCIGSSIAHIYYGTKVVQEMCEHFNIECFHIKPKIK